MKKPLMRKEGLTLIGDMYVPDLSFPETTIHIGRYTLSVPTLSIKAGSHIAITGINGGGKTLFLKTFHEYLVKQGKEGCVLYIPQEFSDGEKKSLLSSFSSLEDEEKGAVLSDMFRMGSNPSSFYSSSVSPSPGELKKLALALSRRDGRTVLLMDEPTNHLDIVSMRILEKMLRDDGRQMTIILVSHDEVFLSSCTDIRWRIERNGNKGRLIC